MTNLYINSRKIEQFRQLQQQLRDRPGTWNEQEQGDCDVLIVPSLSFDQQELLKIDGHMYYEERLLCSLIRLHNPQTRLIYLSSLPISPIIVEYYLQLLPGISFSQVCDRLLLLSAYDNSPIPLTQKILDRPRLLERLQQSLRPGKSYMVCYNSTVLERELSNRLGIPALACDPELLEWGTKSGSRAIFAECGIPHPQGSQLVWTPEDLAEVTAEVWESQPELQRIVIKLNEGFSGEGNALLDLRVMPKIAPGKASHGQRVATIQAQFANLGFQAVAETWVGFAQKIPLLGAIAEAFIEGEEKRSPSVQGYITPRGDVEILSTHDQILGGRDGQIYLGCRFPADENYRLQLQSLGMKVGQALAAKGAVERYGVDFVATHLPSGAWDLQAIEINLRKGGTTHPLMTLKYLTNGYYNPKDGLFYTKQDSQHHNQQPCPKYYIASDNLQKPQYRGLLPQDLIDIIAYRNLHFDNSSKTGNVFHLITALSEFGKVGLTSIGDSLEQAEAFYAQAIAVLDAETSPDQKISRPTLPKTWV